MSTLLALNFKNFFQQYAGEIFRIVEGQHFIVTRKLVDSDEEQRLLEDILDKSKPPAPMKNSHGALHYLLYTPFRYPPLKSGGRFHTRAEQSIFYGAQELITSMSEIAYHRFLFMQHSLATFKPMQVPYTHFLAKVISMKSLLLTEIPFSAQHKKISDPSSYAYSQPLGTNMRKSGAQLFTYFSARKKHGINVGLFSPEAFHFNKPSLGKERHWIVYVDTDSIEFQRLDFKDNQKESHIFNIKDFYVDEVFPVIW